MDVGAEVFLPILFAVLTGFVALNILLNFLLLYIRRQRINLLLSLFWPLVLFVFILQSQIQEGNLAVVLAYSASLLPMTVIGLIGFEIAGRKFPLRNYLFFYLLMYPLTLLLAKLGYGFEITAAPFALATAAPVAHTALRLLLLDRRQTTKLQKIMGVIAVGIAIHCINFALFRMVPGAQLWGWLVAYAIYDALAIILPSIALENAYLTEQERLQTLIRERTAELDTSLEENRRLLKILLHDIFNPLGAMGMYLKALNPAGEQDGKLADGLKRAHADLEQVVDSVKTAYMHGDERSKMEPVALEDCCRELPLIFAKALEEKGVKLIFRSSIAKGSRVLLDRSLFIYSVLCNLVGNALKFSPRGSLIEVTAREEADVILLEVRDQGPGIQPGDLARLSHGRTVASRPGTAGEQGTGMGLSIARSVLGACGGRMEILSSASQLPGKAGTTVRLVLPRHGNREQEPAAIPRKHSSSSVPATG